MGIRKTVSLPPEAETDEIIIDMMMKGCYVEEIYEGFGIEPPGG